MEARTLDQYYLESEAGPGGWYPLGASQTWHNGVHLTRPSSSVVRAVAPGRIVAARFARNDQLDEYPFGSPGFVLVKHRANTFPAEPVHPRGSADPSSLGRVTTEIPFVRNPETGEGLLQLDIGSIVEFVGETASSEKTSDAKKGTNGSSSGTMTFTVEDVHRKVQVALPQAGGKPPTFVEGWISEMDLKSIERLPGASRLMAINTAHDNGGLNCRARTDFGDNVLGAIPEGTEVEVYDHPLRASGDQWQAVRAPEQDIPFGWIVTSKNRVRAAGTDDDATTSAFYSLYMNVAWETPNRTEALVPWMIPYYQHIFDQKISLAQWLPLWQQEGVARIGKDTVARAGESRITLPENLMVVPTLYFKTVDGNKWQKINVRFDEGWREAWVPAKDSTIKGLSPEVDVGRVKTKEDENRGLRYRLWTDFPRRNILGIADKGERAYLSESMSSQKNDRKWRHALFEDGDAGWVSADGSDGKLNVDVPDAFKEMGKKLAEGKCMKLDIPVQAGEPIANVGLIHPRGLLENAAEEQFGVHWEIFSEKNFFNDKHMLNGGWRLVEDDADKDVIIESKETLQKVAASLPHHDGAADLLEQLGWGSSPASTQVDVAEKRDACHERLRLLRTLITKNTSYWSIDWQKVSDNNKAWAREFDFDDDDAEAANKYAWWQECADKDVPLSDEPLVYHYHPVAFLEYLDEQLPKPTPPAPQQNGMPQPASCESDHCPLDRAIRLHKNYTEALNALAKVKTEKAEEKDSMSRVDRLRMAEFVRDVAARAAGEKVVVTDQETGKVEIEDALGEKPRKADDAWPSLRATRSGFRPLENSKGPVKSYGDTYLKKNIEEMKNAIREKEEMANEAAVRLTEHISTKSFQDHLERFHSHELISRETAKACYGLEKVPPTTEQGFMLYSQKNHYLSQLTSKLIATKPGKKFLDKVLGLEGMGENYEVKGPGGLETAKLFQDGLNSIKAAISVQGDIAEVNKLAKEKITDPLSELFSNVTRRVKGIVSEATPDNFKGLSSTGGRMQSIEALLDNNRVDQALTALEEHSGMKLKSWLRSRADDFSDRADSFFNRYADQDSIEDAMQLAYGDVHNQSLPEFATELTSKRGAVQGAQITAVLGALAFAISVPGIVKKWDKLKLTDLMSLVGDVTGLAEGYMSILAAQSKEAEFLANFGTEAAGTVTSMEGSASTIARRLGIVGGILTAAVGAFKAFEAFQNENIDKLLFNLAQFGIGVASIYFALVSATLASGLLALIGIAMIAISYLFVDPPTIDYLQETYWGVNSEPGDPIIPLKKTMDKYYALMYSIRVRLVEPAYLGGDSSFIEITSSAISETSAVYVTVKTDRRGFWEQMNDAANPRATPEVDLDEEDYTRIYPSDQDVDGKGKIQKTNWSGYKRKVLGTRGIIIKKYWEIWDVTRDNKTDYYVEAYLDPDRDGEPEISDFDTAVFPEESDPALVERYDAFPDGTLKKVHGFWGVQGVQFIPYDAGSRIRFKVKTRRAAGCTVHIRVSKDAGASDWEEEVGHWTNQVPVDEEEIHMIPAQGNPGSDDYYELAFEWYLEKNGEQVGHSESETVRVARQAYIDKQEDYV